MRTIAAFLFLFLLSVSSLASADVIPPGPPPPPRPPPPRPRASCDVSYEGASLAVDGALFGIALCGLGFAWTVFVEGRERRRQRNPEA